jgi:hypothetical protein
MESELDVLRDVSARLESAGIAFMLTGSMAMSYYAQPRMTRDIDLVVALTADQTQVVVRLFEADYYLDPQAISLSIARRSMFNLIHNETVIKVDCIVLKSDDYRVEEFERRKLISLGSFQTWIVSLEDLILSKLRWAKDTRSELQLRDVRNLLGAKPDMLYLESRARTLSMSQLLEEALDRNE